MELLAQPRMRWCSLQQGAAQGRCGMHASAHRQPSMAACRVMSTAFSMQQPKLRHMSSLPDRGLLSCSSSGSNSLVAASAPARVVCLQHACGCSVMGARGISICSTGNANSSSSGSRGLRRLVTCAAQPQAHSEDNSHNGQQGRPPGDEDEAHMAPSAANSSLSAADFVKFVQLFRNASPYIEGHRGRVFVIVLPGNVCIDKQLLYSALNDVALLHGLGTKVVVVAGAQNLIDDTLRQRGLTPKYVGGYRITDQDAMRVTIEVAGQLRTQVEQAMSKGPAIPMIRRHTKGDGEIHFEPALNVVSGNYVTAKRRGIVNGIDFGLTGEVRFVLKDAIKKQLEMHNIVLLSNLGFTASGEVLNCSAFEVGLHAAVGLKADKLFCLHTDEVSCLDLPAWLPLSDAQDMLRSRVEGLLGRRQMEVFLSALDSVDQEATLQGLLGSSDMDDFLSALDSVDQEAMLQAQMQMGPASRLPSRTPDAGDTAGVGPVSRDLLTLPSKELLVDLDTWSASGFPPAVSTCVIACCKGVKRAHLLDARLDGGLLLELYTRDGVGTMISADFYEGIRKARDADVDAVQALLEPLEQAGVLVKRSRQQLQDMMPDFIVIERETKLMGCAMLLDLGVTEDGVRVAELGAFCVDPSFRGSGRGDSMLDYVEQEARKNGVRRLVLLTTRTADWFEQRDFKYSGPAFASTLLPEARRARINPARNSQLHVKALEACDASVPKPGKRIGF